MARGWQALVRRSVVVNLTSGRSFAGVLWATNGPLLVLRQAQLLEAGREAMPIDGEVVIETPRIEFMQMLPEPMP